VKKRGQITIFIIIGILILIAAAIVFYIYSITAEKKLTPEMIPAITEMPEELRPVRLYTQECLYQISEEAFRKLGDNGGYIYPEKIGATFNPLNPTESDGLQFSPESPIKIPYWWYLSSKNNCAGNCKFSSLRPELYRTSGLPNDFSVESQVDNYVNEQLKACLDGYLPFKEAGFTIEELGGLKTTTFIGDYDVNVFVDYPLKLSKGNITYTIDRFYVSLPLPFKPLYDLATEIITSETNLSFLERHTLNMIVAFASLDEGNLPPMSESTFEVSAGKFWAVEAVKPKIEEMLMNYVPGLQVMNTLNFERQIHPGNRIRQAVYDNMVLPLNLDGKYDAYEVRFDYLGWWPIYFNAGKDGIISAEYLIPPIIPIGIQRYSTLYDISFPSLVTISDPAAFNQAGYSLRIAMEANIRNNRAIDASFPGFEGINAPGQRSMFCNLNQRNSGNITVVVKNKLTNKGIPKVSVMYTCGEDSCPIGVTSSNGTIIAQFPVCIGGFVSFMNLDYFIPSQRLDAMLDKNELIVSEGYPYVDKNISVMKWGYSVSQKNITSNPLDLAADEQVILTLKKIPDSPGEDNMQSVASYYGNETSTILPKMVPGTYEVNGFLVLHRNFTIPEETRKTGAGFIGGLFGADEEFTIPAITFNESYPSGGAILNEQTGYVVITPDNLYNSKKITFYLISPFLPKHVDEIESDWTGLSSRFRAQLEPTYTYE